MAVAISGVLLASAGCVREPARTPANNDDSVADGGMDAGTGADGGEDAASSACVEPVEDCEERDNMTASCEAGECAYACDADTVDLNDDESDGCECEITAPDDATCDGVDDDCDGEVDEDAPGPMCDNQEGVCAGSTVACDASMEATCEEADYVAHSSDYTADDEESWWCDGMDNDCDGDTDEVCCADGENPVYKTVGDGTFSSITSAVNGAPDGAAFLVGRMLLGDDELRLQHIDAIGDPVGPEVIESLPVDLHNQLQIATGGSFYQVVYRGDDFDNDRDRAYYSQYGPDLTDEITGDEFKQSDESLHMTRIAANGTDTCVAWREEEAGTRGVYVACGPNGTPDRDADPGLVSQTDGAWDIALAAGDDRFAAAWWLPGELHVATMASDGSDLQMAPVTSAGSIREVSLSVAGDELFVAYDDQDDPAVYVRSFALADAAEMMSPVEILQIVPNSLAIHVADSDRDGESDTLVVAWDEDESDLLEIGTTSLETPDFLTGRRTLRAALPAQEAARLQFVEGVRGLGATWSTPVEFVPVAIDGTPVCSAGGQ
jgi:hypothetical protein